jgi:AraC-like DNA-binding protein
MHARGREVAVDERSAVILSRADIRAIALEAGFGDLSHFAPSANSMANRHPMFGKEGDGQRDDAGSAG